MSAPPELVDLQKWLQNAITTPWASAAATPTEVIRGSSDTLTLEQRLRIYTGAYQGRLLECMQTEFPVLKLALGDELFTQFASEYLVACPPDSYSLTALGERFPRYLRETRPADAAGSWPDFIIELATLERCCSEVFNGEGIEHCGGLPATGTEEIMAERGARTLQCYFPVDRYFTEGRDRLKGEGIVQPPEFPAPESVHLLIYRRNYIVQMRRIEKRGP